MEDHHGIGESFYSITCSKIMLATCSLVVMTLMTLSWDKLNPLSDYMLLSSLLIVASMLSPYWLLQGVGKTAAGALITLFARIFTLVVFLCFPITPYSAVLLLVLPNCLAALIMLLWVFSRYHIGQPRFSLPNVTANLKEGWPVFVANSITMVYSASNTILLGIISGPLAAGLYGAAERLVRSGLAVMAPLCQAAYPIICSCRAEQTAKRNKIIKLVLAASFVFGISAFSILNLFSTSIITLLLVKNSFPLPPYWRCCPLCYWSFHLPSYWLNCTCWRTTTIKYCREFIFSVQQPTACISISRQRCLVHWALLTH